MENAAEEEAVLSFVLGGSGPFDVEAQSTAESSRGTGSWTLSLAWLRQRQLLNVLSRARRVKTRSHNASVTSCYCVVVSFKQYTRRRSRLSCLVQLCMATGIFL